MYPTTISVPFHYVPLNCVLLTRGPSLNALHYVPSAMRPFTIFPSTMLSLHHQVPIHQALPHHKPLHHVPLHRKGHRQHNVPLRRHVSLAIMWPCSTCPLMVPSIIMCPSAVFFHPPCDLHRQVLIHLHVTHYYLAHPSTKSQYRVQHLNTDITFDPP